MGDRSIRDGAICRLAERQQGNVARRQLLELGMGSSSIALWVTAGRLIRRYPGVYALGYLREDPLAVAAGAVLACGPGAVLSHDSAAALWGMKRRWPQRPEVSVAADRRPRDIRVHRCRSLPRPDRDRNHGIRATGPRRTLLDIRPRLTTRQFTRLVNQARLDHILPADDAHALLGTTTNPTRSSLEDDFPIFCRTYDLPTPIMNATVNGAEVDALFPEHRVIVEIDHYATHGDPVTFVSDRRRDAHQYVHGFYTHRITPDRFTAEGAAQLRRILAQHRG